MRQQRLQPEGQENQNPDPSSHKYSLSLHSHGDHVHFGLKKTSDPEHSHDHSDHSHDHSHEHHHDHSEHHHDHHEHDESCNHCPDDGATSAKQIGQNDEGCPCCAAAIDLDEVATALNEISAKGANLEAHEHSLGDLANFSSASHWGIFLGIAGPLSLIGLTAAARNIKGTISNKSKLKAAIKGLDEDITRHKERRDNSSGKDKEDLNGVIQRLEAFRETLKYSEFDTKFNLVVPGFINGAASTVVLSSAIVSSPWALPVIALYAGCQTVRNSYDLWRTWNRILPEELRKEVQLNLKVGVRKINQITDSKRKFYAANTLGFAVFAAGAAITTLSALSVVGAPGMVVGIPLLAAGAVATGITNNIWTNKFKPRNGDLGIERAELDLDSIKQEIGERREIKKILKNYRDKHLPNKGLKRFGCSLLSSLPFADKKGAKLLHEVNQSRIAESDSRDSDRLDLLERIINAKKILKKTGDKKVLDSTLKKISALEKISEHEKQEFGLTTIDRSKPLCEQIFATCKDLEIDTMVLERFIKNAIIKSSDEHDTSLKTKEAFHQKLIASGLFRVNVEEIIFDIKALEENEALKKAFMGALEECLLFDYVEKLKYEQYGLNDFYWALDKQNKKHGGLSPVQKRSEHSHADGDCGHHHGHDHHHHHEHPSRSSHEESHEHHHHHDSCATHAHHPTLCAPHLPASETSDSVVLSEDQKSSAAKEEKKLLEEFKSLVAETISPEEKGREDQIKNQNQIIDQVLDLSREFILESEVKNSEKNQTIFTYLDPDHQDPEKPDYEEKQVTYIRDDSTGKIDVIYGEKAKALVIERPDQVKNGVITKIDQEKVEHYGEVAGSVFRSFKKLSQFTELPSSSLQPQPKISRNLSSNKATERGLGG